MDEVAIANLGSYTSAGGSVLQPDPGTWRLAVPSGSARAYRVAQLDDFSGLARGDFPWQPPLRMRLRARASSQAIPGTWGFGFWNDPYGNTIVKGSQLRLPVLPNAAWFFFASPQNYLSLRDDLPAFGQLAATFRSPGRLPGKLALGVPLLPFIWLPVVARWLRGLAREYVQQATVSLDHDPGEWHFYEIDWRAEQADFYLDGEPVLGTAVVPIGPMGLVIWIDNQYASFQPDGHLGYGTLASERGAWIEVAELNLSSA